MSDFPKSQVSCVGVREPETWDDYLTGCMTTFGGGFEGRERFAFKGGMATVVELLKAELPPLEEMMAAYHERTNK